MSQRVIERVISQWRQVSKVANRGEQSDAALLTDFVETRCTRAFEAIVTRHAPWVHRTCWRIVRHRDDADDACQATFMVLMVKAASIKPRTMLPGWLHGVAVKVASRIRAQRDRVQRHESTGVTLELAPSPIPGSATDDESLQQLDREIERLPKNLRTVIILSEIQGKSRREIAQLLQCAEGTVASRLARAKVKLAARLKHLGALGVLFGLASQDYAYALAVTKRELFNLTIDRALAFVPGQALGSTSAQIATEVVKTMLLTKLKLSLAVLAIGFGGAVMVPQWSQAPNTTFATAAPVTPGKADDANKLRDKILPGADQINLELLGSESVRKDLGLTDKQAEVFSTAKADAIKREQDRFNAEIQKQLQGLQVGGGGAGVGGIAIAPGNMVRIGGDPFMHKSGFSQSDPEFAKAVKGSLTEKQMERLREIEFQTQGPGSYTNRKAIRHLAITEAQEDALVKIYDTTCDHQMKLMTAILKDDKEAIKELTASYNKAIDQCHALLTKEQQAQWASIIGKRIDAGTAIADTAHSNMESINKGIPMNFPIAPGALPLPPGVRIEIK